jgi:two-component system phosphate regulon sensor histidine kinase PhoR
LKFNKLNTIIFVGFLAIVGVLFMQLLMLNQAYAFEKKEYSEKIYFALQDIVQKIYRDNKTQLPIKDQIKKVTEDYYIVNVDDVFEAKVLEYYLKTEFQKVKLDLDFEYAIYDCGSDEMIYGDYISSSDDKTNECENCFEKKEGLIYYFAVRFPNLKYSLIGSLGQYWIYTSILILVLIIYVYSVILLLKQKKYSELQNDFINNMTHEFKTPLASILIASNYANSQEEIKNNPKLHKYMDIIIKQSNKLNQHIERMLTVAKGDANWIELDKKSISLTEMILLVEENVLLKTDKKVSLQFENQKNYLLHADEFHLYNVFYNIVDNAIKYGTASPEIIINCSENEKNLVISFADNGPGIEQKHLDYVFDKFYRVPRESKNEIEGFGIGLSYVKKIIDLHRWNISIQNNTPTGIIVTITIPKKDVL